MSGQYQVNESKIENSNQNFEYFQFPQLKDGVQ